MGLRLGMDHLDASIPILNLVDQPGFAIGQGQPPPMMFWRLYHMRPIHHTCRFISRKDCYNSQGAAALSALYNATVPIFTIIIRRAFGVAGGAFGDPDDGRGYRVAWPSGDWGSLPLEGGIEAAYKRQLEATGSPEARERFMNELLDKFEDVRSPLRTAHRFGIEEIIDPRDTRPLACEWVTHVYHEVLPQLVNAKQVRYGFDSKPSSGRGYKL